MQAVIMAGGLGTRLQPFTNFVPKPMVPVGNRPILEHIILLLKQHQITRIILLLYYLPRVIQEHFGDGSQFGVEIEYMIAAEDFATAGAVKLTESLLDEPFLVFSGDAITDLNLTKFIEFHQEKKGPVTIALSHILDPAPFGITLTDKKSRVTRFLEKPMAHDIFSHRVNMGIYVLEPQVFDFIPEQKEVYFAQDLFPDLLNRDEPLFGFAHQGYWMDVGNLTAYRQVQRDFFDKKIQLQLHNEMKNGVSKGRECKIGAGVKFEGQVVIGNHCVIEDGVCLRDSVIGSHCRIGRDSILKDVIVWENRVVGKNSELVNEVLANL